MAKIKRWQWIVISLILGLVAGWARSWLGGPPRQLVGAFGSNRDFEDALIEMRDPDTRALQNIVVRRLANGDYRVDATYWMSNRTWMQRGPDGQVVAKPAARQFITGEKYLPGRPLNVDASRLSSRPWLERVAEAMGMRRPDPEGTIVDYLREAQATHQVDFDYLWWKEPRVEIFLWTAGSLVIVGLCWPTLVTFLAFGRLTRPRQEKGIDLSKVRSTPAADPIPGPADSDLDKLRRLEAELEARLKEGPAAPASPTSLASAPVARLTGQTDEAPKPLPAPDEKAFAAKPDDFYPTERQRAPKR